MSKRRFASLEDSLERLIEGGFARLFRGSLQPRTVAVQLVRAIEDNLVPADDGRDAAPTLFEIHLCASTHAALMAQAPDVAQQLSRQVVTYCLEADLFLAALPEVTLEPDPTSARTRSPSRPIRQPQTRDHADHAARAPLAHARPAPGPPDHGRPAQHHPQSARCSPSDATRTTIWS
jgi:hypothetical protein